MYESTPRSREVANALFQIDRLNDDQARAILRHITIDDAILNEAQCSHIASVISGTLNKVPREGVNATLTCTTSLDAASQWEKSYASHPGHVSSTFRKRSINHGAEAHQTAKQVVLYRPEESGPASRGTMPSVSLPPDLKGLTIVNQGQLTLHYHSYNGASSPAPQSATVPRKRTLERVDNEGYSEALASLMEFDSSPLSLYDLTANPKRRRLEEPDIEMVELEVDKPQKIDKLEMVGKPEKIVKPQKVDNPEKKVKQEQEQPAQDEAKKKDSVCKRCGNAFHSAENKEFKLPCNHHPGTFLKYPSGVKKKASRKFAVKKGHSAWSCCKSDANSPGCLWGKHEEDRN